MLPRRHPDERSANPRVAGIASPAGLLLQGAPRRRGPGWGRDREGGHRAAVNDRSRDRRAALPARPPTRAGGAALGIPALPDGWKASFREIADQAERSGGSGADGTGAAPTAAAAAAARRGTRAGGCEPAGVARIQVAGRDGRRAGERIRRLCVHCRPRWCSVAASPGGPVPDAAAAACAAGQPLLRSYSLSGAPGTGAYRVSVKREQHGAASQFIHDHVRAGDLLEVAAPRGTFILRPGTAPVLLISAGVGATPVLAMLHALAASGSAREIWWLHGARSRAEEPFAAESKVPADRTAARRTGTSATAVLARKTSRDATISRAGRLSAPALRALDLPARGRRLHLRAGRVHGGGLGRRWWRSGLTGARIRTEIFGAAPSLTPGIADSPARPVHAPAGRAGQRRGGRLCAQRADRPLGYRIWQPAGAGRGLRRPRALVMPHAACATPARRA